MNLNNPDYRFEFGDYLTCNDFRSYVSDNGRFITFFNGDKAARFENDSLLVMEKVVGDDDRGDHITVLAKFDGLSQMDDFKFMLQMHIFDIVTLKDFVQRVKRKEPVLFSGLFDHFTPEDLPINY